MGFLTKAGIGKYVWKKHKYYPDAEYTINFNFIKVENNTTFVQVVPDGIPLERVTTDVLTEAIICKANTNTYLQIKSATNITYYYSGGSSNVSYTYDDKTGVLSFTGTYEPANFIYQNHSGSLAAEIAGFIGNVVANNEAAYPDGDVKDRYWYERVSEGLDLLKLSGFTKMAIDKFSFSANTGANTYTNIPHSLKEKPRAALIMVDVNTPAGDVAFPVFIPLIRSDTTGTTISNVALRRETSGYLTHMNVKAGASDFANDYIKVQLALTTVYFKAGLEYTIITFV